MPKTFKMSIPYLLVALKYPALLYYRSKEHLTAFGQKKKKKRYILKHSFNNIKFENVQIVIVTLFFNKKIVTVDIKINAIITDCFNFLNKCEWMYPYMKGFYVRLLTNH